METGIDSFAAIFPEVGGSHHPSPADRMEALVEKVETADHVGLHVFGIGEHHRKEFLDAAPSVILAAVAAKTKSIRLSSAVAVLSANDPVRVFQELPTINLVSKGRAEIAVGRGSLVEAYIDAANARAYESLNNGVYCAGFATRQDVYETAVTEVLDTLDWLESRLRDGEYLVGDALTEANVRMFTTLVRFDAVYFSHFKCNRRALRDYARLWAHTRRLAQHPKLRPTINFQHIKSHYYSSHPWLNHSGIGPVGPDADFDAPI